MEAAGVQEIFGVMGERLFGEEAFRDPTLARPLMKEELTRLVSSIVAHIWSKNRGLVANEFERLKRGTIEARGEFGSALLCSQITSIPT